MILIQLIIFNTEFSGYNKQLQEKLNQIINILNKKVMKNY